ncbi:MAG: hypothetical protein EXX96DRAFT_206689 [Benjaminiella poitrasii]|nr:MAG: hypothetical protein EXX96DRAFT_206689 [Benjaminiella poitrasii]
MHSVNNHSPTNDISRTSSSAAAAIVGNHRNDGCDSKSPMSSLSLNESRYGFSFLERAEDSNYSTLPTSRSNSFSSTYLDHTLDSQRKRTASHERVLNGLQSSPRSISVYMDKFAWQTSNEYKWMIETVSTNRKQDITVFNTQPTLIQSEDTSVETQSLKQHIKPDIDYPKRQHFAIDSFIATLDILEKEHSTMKNSPPQDERPQPQQKSQWLDGNSKLYSLANNSSCSCSSASSDNHLPKPDNKRTMKSTNTSRYNTAPESIRSARSFSSLSDQNPIFSEKKLGKQPLRQTRLTLQGSSKSFSSSSSSSSSDRSHPWTSATPTPSGTHTSAASEQTARALPPPLSLTEAEVYKREHLTRRVRSDITMTSWTRQTVK